MKAKDFVLEKYPKAYSEKFRTGSNLHKSIKGTYFLIWASSGVPPKKRLGKGDTESKAWKDAKENILETLTPQ